MPMYRLILALAGTIVGIIITPHIISLISWLLRRSRREKKSGYPDLWNLREGEEIVWVGGYPYIVGGSQKR